MTTTTMDLKELLEKTADPAFLRDMIGFTAQRLMDLEVETLAGAAHGARDPDRLTTATATVPGNGKPGRARCICKSRKSARAATSPASWNRGAWPRRH
jgi:hypothetical protein